MKNDNESSLWDRFQMSGMVEDYLKYKSCHDSYNYNYNYRQSGDNDECEGTGNNRERDSFAGS